MYIIYLCIYIYIYIYIYIIPNFILTGYASCISSGNTQVENIGEAGVDHSLSRRENRRERDSNIKGTSSESYSDGGQNIESGSNVFDIKTDSILMDSDDILLISCAKNPINMSWEKAKIPPIFPLEAFHSHIE